MLHEHEFIDQKDSADKTVALSEIRHPLIALTPENVPISMSADINASAVLDAINQWPEESRPPVTAIFVQMAGKVLHDFPLLNGTFLSETEVRFHSQIHIAVGVNTPAGLQFPVIADVERKDLSGLHEELKQLEKQAFRGELTEENTSGATFTVVNLGMFGISQFDTALYSSQMATLGVGAISYRLVMTGNRIINLPFFTATLTCDARVIDLAMAAKFLHQLKETLEE